MKQLNLSIYNMFVGTKDKISGEQQAGRALQMQRSNPHEKIS